MMNPHESQTAVSVPLVWALASTPAARGAIADMIFSMTGLPWLGPKTPYCFLWQDIRIFFVAYITTTCT